MPPLRECVNDDNACPATCNEQNDNDCMEPPPLPTPTNECNGNADCNDGNEATLDSCSFSIPRTCSSTLKTCSQLGGSTCSASETCTETVQASDGACCTGSCEAQPIQSCSEYCTGQGYPLGYCSFETERACNSNNGSFIPGCIVQDEGSQVYPCCCFAS